MNDDIAGKIYIGIVSDTNRFLFNTSAKKNDLQISIVCGKMLC